MPDQAAIDRDKVPSNAAVVTAPQFDLQRSTNLLDGASPHLRPMMVRVCYLRNCEPI